MFFRFYLPFPLQALSYQQMSEQMDVPLNTEQLEEFNDELLLFMSAMLGTCAGTFMTHSQPFERTRTSKYVVGSLVGLSAGLLCSSLLFRVSPNVAKVTTNVYRLAVVSYFLESLSTF